MEEKTDRKTNDIVSIIYHYDEKKVNNLIKDTFKKEKWLRVFLNDNHHGYLHGNQVRMSCLKLEENLNPREKEKLLKEGEKINKKDPHKYAVIAIEIAAIFHDCGRFNEEGMVVFEEQKNHYVLSANRAEKFCNYLGLNMLAKSVKEAIFCHDYQSKKITPHLNTPKTITGKIVQSADQMGWFHPESVYRTLAFNKALGLPFYDPNTTLEERLMWRTGNKNNDSVTVMLNQLFGPISNERFGIEYARKKVENYKIDLEKNIIKIAQKDKLKNEIKTLIKKFSESKLIEK